METTYPHQEALEDNNFEIKDLPESIRKRIYSWNNKYKKFQENPTERLKDNILADSVSIADSIQDFAEQGIEDTNQSPQLTPSEQNQPDIPAIAGVVNPNAQNDLKEAIKQEVSKEGRIYHSNLKQLLGTSGLPDRVEVGELVLTRSFAFYYPA